MTDLLFADIECAAIKLDQVASLMTIVLEEHHDNLHNPGRLEVEEEALYLATSNLSDTAGELRRIAKAMLKGGADGGTC